MKRFPRKWWIILFYIIVNQFLLTGTHRKLSWRSFLACPARWSSHSGPPNSPAVASEHAALTNRPSLADWRASIQVLWLAASTAGSLLLENPPQNQSSWYLTSAIASSQLTFSSLCWTLHGFQTGLVPAIAFDSLRVPFEASLSDHLFVAEPSQFYTAHWSSCRHSSSSCGLDRNEISVGPKFVSWDSAWILTNSAAGGMIWGITQRSTNLPAKLEMRCLAPLLPCEHKHLMSHGWLPIQTAMCSSNHFQRFSSLQARRLANSKASLTKILNSFRLGSKWAVVFGCQLRVFANLLAATSVCHPS